ncbi:MAG: tyrosine-type recombinase/integrase [Actinobacteria bacterium]|nr:tyrosine-type recombinase/integrase [Actinomycetota bacterium]
MAGRSREVLSGPLEPFVVGFAAELSQQGFKPVPVVQQLELVADLDRWLAAEGVGLAGLSSEVAERFCEARRAAGCTSRVTVRALGPLLGYLRGLGVAPPASTPAPAGAVEELLSRFGRYLEQERGLVPAAARGYVDKVRPFLERFDGPDGLELALLASCDRSTVAGVRDLAILTVLARLGLRAGEVAGLSLEDVDWRAGEIVVCGKGERSERLPLPVDVGEAIVGYLRDGRPVSAQGRTLFLRVVAPHCALTTGGVTQVVVAAARRAGLGQIHAHRLRHTAASEMLRAGATLPEVGHVLRHRRAASTAIYAKVDREALRTIARPWPGATR